MNFLIIFKVIKSGASNLRYDLNSNTFYQFLDKLYDHSDLFLNSRQKLNFERINQILLYDYYTEENASSIDIQKILIDSSSRLEFLNRISFHYDCKNLINDTENLKLSIPGISKFSTIIAGVRIVTLSEDMGQSYTFYRSIANNPSPNNNLLKI